MQLVYRICFFPSCYPNSLLTSCQFSLHFCPSLLSISPHSFILTCILTTLSCCLITTLTNPYKSPSISLSITRTNDLPIPWLYSKSNSFLSDEFDDNFLLAVANSIHVTPLPQKVGACITNLTLLCSALPCSALFCPVLSCHVMSCHVLSCEFVSPLQWLSSNT